MLIKDILFMDEIISGTENLSIEFKKISADSNSLDLTTVFIYLNSKQDEKNSLKKKALSENEKCFFNIIF